jgi:hypothetical protein
MKKFKAKEILWFLMPCAIPLVVLALPSFKSAPPPQFKPVVDEVHFARTWNRTNLPDSRSYLVTIYINHTGPRPQWWGKSEGVATCRDFPNGSYISSGGLMSDLVDPHFVDARGKTYWWHSMGASFNLYDAKSQRYVIHCDTDVLKDFKVENSRFVTGVKTAWGTYKVNTVAKLSPPL